MRLNLSIVETMELPANLEERIVDHLAGRGVRFTAGRRLVVEELARTDGPCTAPEIHDGLVERVPVSSLYRTLAVLTDAGVIARTHDIEGITRFELAEWIVGHHHHLVCLQCGGVEDVDMSPEVEIAVGNLLESVGTAAEFRVSSHRIDIEGVCRRCPK